MAELRSGSMKILQTKLGFFGATSLIMVAFPLGVVTLTLLHII